MTGAPVCAVRLHLVRHGETQSNKNSIVVGQSDSPLSRLGRLQAEALRLHPSIRNTEFWRCYVSDLGRAVRTARIVSPDRPPWHKDARLREIAKGVREGRPKRLTYAQALAEYRRERPDADLPRHESLDDAWERLYRFLREMMHERCQQCSDRTCNVLVVTHSGLLRLFLHKLVPDAHPHLASLTDTDGALDGETRFKIPNASVTVLDLTAVADNLQSTNATDYRKVFRAKLIALNRTDHYAFIEPTDDIVAER